MMLKMFDGIGDNLNLSCFYFRATASGRLNIQGTDGNPIASFTRSAAASQFITDNNFSWQKAKSRKVEFLNSSDWQSAWQMFIKTKTFQIYKTNIVSHEAETLIHDDDEKEIPQFKFR